MSFITSGKYFVILYLGSAYVHKSFIDNHLKHEAEIQIISFLLMH